MASTFRDFAGRTVLFTSAAFHHVTGLCRNTRTRVPSPTPRRKIAAWPCRSVLGFATSLSNTHAPVPSLPVVTWRLKAGANCGAVGHEEPQKKQVPRAKSLGSHNDRSPRRSRSYARHPWQPAHPVSWPAAGPAPPAQAGHCAWHCGGAAKQARGPPNASPKELGRKQTKTLKDRPRILQTLTLTEASNALFTKLSCFRGSPAIFCEQKQCSTYKYIYIISS